MKRLLLFFSLITAANAAVFFFREKFQFVKYSTHEELYGGCDEACRNKWDDFLLPYSEVSLAEARKILGPLRLDSSTTIFKAKAIAHHLYTKFYKQSGYPLDIIHRSAPIEQYKILSADTTQKVWCGTYAQMFSFFCWSQNIVCRNVEIFRPGDHHVFNECFVPETGGWMMVDVTNNIASVERGIGLLNAQDFITAAFKAPLLIRTAFALQAEPVDSFEQSHGLRNYYNAAYPFYYYHSPHTAIVYGTTAKLKRYFLPDYWYEVFSPQRRNNFLFWVKPFLAALWLILAGTIVFKLLSK